MFASEHPMAIPKELLDWHRLCNINEPRLALSYNRGQTCRSWGINESYKIVFTEGLR